MWPLQIRPLKFLIFCQFILLVESEIIAFSLAKLVAVLIFGNLQTGLMSVCCVCVLAYHVLHCCTAAVQVRRTWLFCCMCLCNYVRALQNRLVLLCFISQTA